MFFTKKKDALPVPIQDDYEIINEKNKIPLGLTLPMPKGRGFLLPAEVIG